MFSFQIWILWIVFIVVSFFYHIVFKKISHSLSIIFEGWMSKASAMANISHFFNLSLLVWELNNIISCVGNLCNFTTMLFINLFGFFRHLLFQTSGISLQSWSQIHGSNSRTVTLLLLLIAIWNVCNESDIRT